MHFWSNFFIFACFFSYVAFARCEEELRKPEVAYKIVYDKYPTIHVYLSQCAAEKKNCTTPRPGPRIYIRYKNERDRAYNNISFEDNEDSVPIKFAIPDLTYEVQVVSASGSATKESEWIKFKVPQTDPPSYVVEALFGSDVEIPCKAPLSSTPDIQWLSNGQPISSQLTKPADKDRVSTLKSGSLEIRNLTLSDEGEFSCVDKNLPNGKPSSSYLVVKNRTIITNLYEFGEKKTYLGTLYMTSCEVYKDLYMPVDVKWMKNGDVIDTGIYYYNPYMFNNIYKRLKFRVENESSFTTYTCLAESNLDVVHERLTLVDSRKGLRNEYRGP